MHEETFCTLQTIHAPNFAPVSLKDRDWMREIFAKENSRSSDWCFSNIFNWNELNCHRLVAQLRDRLGLMLQYKGECFFGYPIGSGPLEPAVDALAAIAKAHDVPLRLRGLTVEHVQALETAYPGKFSFSTDENTADYVYPLEKIATLAGKKLSAKRNHINRFFDNFPNWQFESIDQSNIADCVEMNEDWMVQHAGSIDFSLEKIALGRAFAHFDKLGLEGGLLRVDGAVAAYTIGEVLCDDTYIVHFEKAFGDMQGAYPLINREFARYIWDKHPHMQYVNREDDLGLDHLRRAKRSYYPEFMVEKYIALEIQQ